MDERTFIRSHFQDGKSYNSPGALNININRISEESSKGIITGIIIHVEAHSIDGQTDETRIEGVLGQIEKVKFNVEGKLYELDITSKQYYPAKVPFIYYTIEPEIIDDIFDANLVGTVHKNIEVTFSPFLIFCSKRINGRCVGILILCIKVFFDCFWICSNKVYAYHCISH